MMMSRFKMAQYFGAKIRFVLLISPTIHLAIDNNVFYMTESLVLHAVKSNKTLLTSYWKRILEKLKSLQTMVTWRSKVNAAMTSRSEPTNERTATEIAVKIPLNIHRILYTPCSRYISMPYQIKTTPWSIKSEKLSHFYTIFSENARIYFACSRCCDVTIEIGRASCRERV